MRISKECEEKLKSYEGLELEAYLCPAGVPTIGWGHTEDVRMDMVITVEKAQELFEQDIEEVERPLSKEPYADSLRQGQWDALVSFIYNLGWGNYKTSTLRKRILEDIDHDDIPNQFKRWNKSNGKVLQGLVKRWEWEADMYTHG